MTQQKLPRSEPLEGSGFGRLVAPLTREEFLSEHWGKRHLYLGRNEPGFYADLFTSADLDGCLHVAREASRRVVTVVPPFGSNERPRQLRGSDLSGHDLQDAGSQGATVVVHAAELLSARLARWALEIGHALEVRTKVNAYATPGGAQGFPVHFDTHDVLVLQIAGEKRWSLYRTYAELPIDTGSGRHVVPARYQPRMEEDSELLEEVCLEAGDLLYLPRGVPHRAVAVDSVSLHLTVGLYPLYWMDLLKTAIEIAARSEGELRAALPPGWTEDRTVRAGMRQELERLWRRVIDDADRCHDPALDALVGELQRGRARTQPEDSRFGRPGRAGEVGLETELVRRPDLAVVVTRSQDSASLGFGDREIRGPASIGPALELVRERPRFRPADLPRLSDRSRLVLARRLVNEGLVASAEDLAAGPGRGER